MEDVRNKMKIFLNCANYNFSALQNFSLKMAKKHGNFDKIISYNIENIDKFFKKSNSSILREPKGAGYFLWKPYFIYKTLIESNEGDYIFYLDSGCYIKKKIDVLINDLNNFDQDIMPFETFFSEEQWTKKELFKKMDCNNDNYKKTNQIAATYILIKNTKKSKAFIKKWLNYSKLKNNICDSKLIKNESPQFIEHRHDQSIYSLLCKKEKLICFRNPSEMGELNSGYAMKEKISRVYKKQVFFNYKTYNNSHYDNIIFNSKKINPKISFIYFFLINQLKYNGFFYNLLLNIGLKKFRD